MAQAHQGTALITGAASGLGAVYADQLVRREYDLILVAQNRDRTIALANRVTNDTRQSVEVIDADLNDRAALAYVEVKLKQDASITLVNNAGIGTHTPLLESDVDAMTRMIALPQNNVIRLRPNASSAGCYVPIPHPRKLSRPSCAATLRQRLKSRSWPG
jgi:short-subunit dehydrogenase